MFIVNTGLPHIAGSAGAATIYVAFSLVFDVIFASGFQTALFVVVAVEALAVVRHFAFFSCFAGLAFTATAIEVGLTFVPDIIFAVIRWRQTSAAAIAAASAAESATAPNVDSAAAAIASAASTAAVFAAVTAVTIIRRSCPVGVEVK
jgi:hypothetical protein